MHPNDLQEPELPEPVAAFIRAVNAGDLGALVDTFADQALVNDELREYWDKRSITEWAEREVITQHLVMRVAKIVRNHDHTVVAATVDGSFDKRGLPDPLIVTFYFSCRDDRLVQLLILRNEPDQ
ncbi:nuclear transport factor 2 family protein [Pendulispora brunnea]|uniref:Nuclear transport factor 2 family protein n=1 Tax=Pendulispora brunnea TaxID=2905690 RepID=A0ABZ2KBX0_9BACT